MTLCPTMTDGCLNLNCVILGVQCPPPPVVTGVEWALLPLWSNPSSPVSCDTLINNNTSHSLTQYNLYYRFLCSSNIILNPLLTDGAKKSTAADLISFSALPMLWLALTASFDPITKYFSFQIRQIAKTESPSSSSWCSNKRNVQRFFFSSKRRRRPHL